jgi:DNA-binding XRE family transcriptional regulator
MNKLEIKMPAKAKMKHKEIVVKSEAGETLTQLAIDLKVSRQSLYETLSKFSQMLFEANPDLKKEIDEFDTCIDLTKKFDYIWVGAIEKIFLLNNKNTTTTPLKNGIIIDKKLKHTLLKQKPKSKQKKEYNILRAEFFKKIENKLPLKIEEVADELGCDREKFKCFINEVLFDYIGVHKGYIYTFKKVTPYRLLKLCVESDVYQQNFKGNLEDIFNEIFNEHKEFFLERNIKDFSDFLEFLKGKISNLKYDTFLVFDVNKKRYELLKYAKENNIEYLKINDIKKNIWKLGFIKSSNK